MLARAIATLSLAANRVTGWLKAWMSLWPHGIVSSAITKHLMGASALG